MAATWVRTRRDRVAALEAAEEDRAVQDDVLAQGLGQQLEVLGFGGAAEGVRLGHRHHFTRPGILAPCRATASTRAISTSLGATGPALGRQAEHAALPAQRRPDRRQGRPGAGPAADHHRPQVGPAAHRAGRLPRRRRALRRDQHQRRQRQGPGLVAQPARRTPRPRSRSAASSDPVRARIAEGEERADLWRRHNEQYAGFDDYEEKLDRETAVIVLEPRQAYGRPSSRRAASAPRAGAAASSACCSRSGGSARG